jgi:hypothetical protein
MVSLHGGVRRVIEVFAPTLRGYAESGGLRPNDAQSVWPPAGGVRGTQTIGRVLPPSPLAPDRPDAECS